MSIGGRELLDVGTVEFAGSADAEELGAGVLGLDGSELATSGSVHQVSHAAHDRQQMLLRVGAVVLQGVTLGGR